MMATWKINITLVPFNKTECSDINNDSEKCQVVRTLRLECTGQGSGLTEGDTERRRTKIGVMYARVAAFLLVI